jgi:hypothetical protein
MSDIIDINVNPTVEEVTIDVQPNVTVVNVNTIQGIPEAPIDGEIYGRQDASWEIIPPVDVSALVPYTGATTDVDLGENGISTGFVKFDTTPTDIPEEQGAMFWDEDDNTVDVILNGYRMKIGEDTFYPVKNQSGSTILKGTNVKFAGTVGASARLLILPFLANGTDPSYVYMGVTAEDIADGEDGKVLWFGRLRGLNTNAFNEGDVLYASTTSAGGFQTAIPTGTNNVVQVSAVIKKSTTQGVIFIRPQIEPFAKIPTLQEVTDEGAVTTNPISVPELKLYDESNDDYSYIKVNDNTLFFYNASGEIVYSFAFGSNSINFDVGDITSNRNYSFPDAIGKLQLSPIRVVGSVTALNGATYYNESTATYTDPPPLSGQGFIVIVGGGTATIGGVGYTSGNLIYRFYQGGAWSSTVFGVSDGKLSATQITGITILETGWNLVGSFFEYELSNANITSTSIVEAIPDNSAIDIVRDAELLPRTDSSSGSVKFYSVNEPSGDFTITINIYK